MVLAWNLMTGEPDLATGGEFNGQKRTRREGHHWPSEDQRNSKFILKSGRFAQLRGHWAIPSKFRPTLER